MRLDINLATHPYEDARRFWIRWGAGLAALFLVTLGLVYSAAAGWASAEKDRTLIRQSEQQIAQRDAEMQTAQTLLNRPQNAAIRDRSQFLNDLFERKAFSWTKVFADLEQVMPARLHLVSIHPEMSRDHQLQLKLMVAGESRGRAIELVRNMENSRRFEQAHIEEESDLVTSTAGDNAQFQISTLYVPELEVIGRQGGK
jgi:type IV pilus assembly protein PilN